MKTTICNFKNDCDKKILEITTAKNNRIRLLNDLTNFLNTNYDIVLIERNDFLVIEFKNPAIGIINDDSFNAILNICDNIDKTMRNHVMFLFKNHNKLSTIENVIRFDSINRLPLLKMFISCELKPTIDLTIDQVNYI